MHAESSVFTEFNATEKKVEYAGFWLRFVAYFIDALIFYIPTEILHLLFGIRGILNTFFHVGSLISYDPSDLKRNYIISQFILLFLIFLYSALMESSARQGTLGKIILRIKITDLNYERLSFKKAAERFFAKYFYFIVPVLFLFLFFVELKIFTSISIPFMIIWAITCCISGWTASKQALHDMIAKTYVIKKSPHEVIQQEEPVEGY